MADNTDEVHLDNPTNIQSESPREEIAPTVDTETINPNQETENMEVHKHPHHVTHKKRWGEYFLEFLMLFLAVFLGFIAENVREHNVEKKRLKEYLGQMVENLKADTIRCRSTITRNNSYSNYLDSLYRELGLASGATSNANRMYYYYLKGNNFSGVLFKQAAITQLKNSGNVRLIENKELANEIQEYYDRWVVAANTKYEFLRSRSEIVSNNANNFFYSKYFNELKKPLTTFSYANVDSRESSYALLLNKNPTLTLMTTNPIELAKFSNEISDMQNSLTDYSSFLNLNLTLADTLLTHIQKEYHF